MFRDGAASETDALVALLSLTRLQSLQGVETEGALDRSRSGYQRRRADDLSVDVTY